MSSASPSRAIRKRSADRRSQSPSEYPRPRKKRALKRPVVCWGGQQVAAQLVGRDGRSIKIEQLQGNFTRRSTTPSSRDKSATQAA
jgi:hypothetical protein